MKRIEDTDDASPAAETSGSAVELRASPLGRIACAKSCSEMEVKVSSVDGSVVSVCLGTGLKLCVTEITLTGSEADIAGC